MRHLALIAALAILGNSASFGGEIDFLEDFALAKDRAAVLKQLVPGTEDFSYYYALHFIQTEQFDKLDGLLTNWVQRHGETPRVREIRTRFALAIYDKNPQKTLDYLRTRLGLTFSHQKEVLNAEPDFPTALDIGQISREAYLRRANAITTDNADQFEDGALDWLVGTELSPNLRRSVLSRLTRPDYEKLLKHVVDDLNYDRSSGFGSLGIHRQLLIAQLEDLVKAKPDLLNNQNFVMAYLTKLQPTDDEDWRHHPVQLEAYLDRLTKFANRLAPVHNSLKSHVIYHRLVLDRLRGEFNKDRFVEYLKLPRSVGYLSKKMLASEPFKKFPSDLNANYGGATLLAPIGNDEPLVRSYLAQFLVDAANTKEFEPYINDIYLQQLFAEVKIVNGLGDAEQWAALLPPSQYQQLKERVDLDFAFTNKTQFGQDEPVKLELFVKNVGTLIVKVFEINTQNFYREQHREVDTDINLDGLVANSEQTQSLPEPPLRRVTRKFDFPQLQKPGVYVIDFIGNGRSSRALIKKGHLSHLVRTAPVGHVFTILNDHNQQLKDATLWMAGHEYTAGANGEILVPFSTSGGDQPIVISHNGFASLNHFQHAEETYNLTAGCYVDRESLLTRNRTQLLVRPGLFVNGTQVATNLLEEVKLKIISTDLDGITSSQEVANFPLFEDRETAHEFQVPPRLASLSFELTAQVKKLSEGGKKEDLKSSTTITLNDIDRTEKIECPHLAKIGTGYVLELRGKTGEAKTSRPVQLAIKHRDFRQQYDVTLKTDASGRINLGPLSDIIELTALAPENSKRQWSLPTDAHTYRRIWHSKIGEPIMIPFMRESGIAADAPIARSELSLLEVRGNVFVEDRFKNVSLKDGFVVLSKLPAGDYDLQLKSSVTPIHIRVTDGPLVGRYLLGQSRQLETEQLAALQIESIKPAADGVTIKLRNVNKFSRVHVFATRYLPEYSVFENLSQVAGTDPTILITSPVESLYLTGRNIGDEYRYIIDRKYAKKFPGNMLDRPSLLLNPWSVRETATSEQHAQQGGAFAPGGMMGGMGGGMNGHERPVHSTTNDHFANLDFLASASTVSVNLVPNEDGVINLDAEAIGPHQQIHVVAVDPLNVTYRSISLPERKTTFRDLRLVAGLDPAKHFTQQKQISIVPAGRAFTLQDITTAKFAAYDSLEHVYALYATLSHDPKLAEFSFLLDWPHRKPEEKRSLYSKYASHELSFFLFKKDPEFFNAVIKPSLANKKDRTFVDRLLLEEDLSVFLSPWQYEQLNIVERILLAQRLKDERPRTARHVSDLYALLPPNIDNFTRLFDTAVKRGSLETGDPFGIAAESVRLTDTLWGQPVPGAPMGTASTKSQLPGLQVQPRDQAFGESDAVERKAADLKTHSRDLKKNKVRESIVELHADSALPDEAKEAISLFENLPELADSDAIRQLYRKLGKTMEWAENNYHHLTIDQQNSALVTVNAFWNDFAQHDPATPFLSRNLAEASRNFSEMMFALAILDLPFAAPKHDTRFDGAKMTFTPGGPLVVFHEEIKPSAEADRAATVLVSQNLFREGDRTRIENGEQIDKFVVGEFLNQVVYGCQVVVTNPTSTRQKLNLLLQIPLGAVPVKNSQVTKTVPLDLEPYHTQTAEYFFYFPTPGQYTHFPVHVAKNETLIAATAAVTLNVVDKPTTIDTGSWEFISQNGSTEDVLRFLDTHNIAAVNLDRIAWRMRDVEVFTAVVTKLSQRHVYHQTLWSYALKHNRPAAAREFLSHADLIINECGGRLSSPLLTIDPVARRTFEHLEYKPLVNARTHVLGKRRQIVNDRFHAQYHRTLKQLSYERTLKDDDLLTVTYYLLLQDRVEEAIASFARVNVDKISTKMQYDYCAAYLDFFTDDHQQARTIAAKYIDHPVDRWRQTFAAITAQLDEAELKEPPSGIEPDRNQQTAQLAATEPSLDLTVEARQIKIDYQNLQQVRVNFYEMDVELQFSHSPFAQQFRGQFSSIKPNLSIDVALEEGAKADAKTKHAPLTKTIPLPAALQNKNVLVEVVGAGLTKTQAYYSHSLSVQVIENYGHLKVTHQTTGQPVPKAYVKVYAQLSDGRVKFYKDGYTDLRGRFDFASLNTNDLDVAVKFSLLIISEEFGAVVREATPPKQ